MHRTDEDNSQLDLSAERETADEALKPYYDEAERLSTVLGIETYYLAFDQIAQAGDSPVRDEVAPLHERFLAACGRLESAGTRVSAVAIRHRLGQLLAMIGELDQAVECFERVRDDVGGFDDVEIVLRNLLVVQLARHDFRAAEETVRKLAMYTPPAPPKLELPPSRLRIHAGPLRGKEYDLDTPTAVLGRSTDCDIVIDDRMVSRRHAQLRYDGTTWMIEDLGSVGGVWVNERRIEAATALNDGDCIRLANIELWFMLHAMESACSMAEVTHLPTADAAEQPSRSCERCGADIRPERLEMLPETRLCLDCSELAKEQVFLAADQPLDRQVTLKQIVQPESTSSERRELPEEPQPTEPPPPYLDENVQFTVYRPRNMVPKKWYPLLGFAHLSDKPPEAEEHEPEPVEQVKQQAAAVLGDQAAVYQDTTQDSLHAVPREGELTMVPQIEGVQFNPERRTFTWEESVHREEFRMKAGSELVGKTARGRLTVFLGSIILAEVPLAVRVVEHEEPQTEQKLEPESAKAYRKIFASYSHRDLPIVEQFEHYVGMLGDEYLRDWKHLRSGQIWNDRLMEMIGEADVFQLFWSSNSMRSPYVRREWEYALSLGRPNFVRPTYWEDPLPSEPDDNLPPESLLRLHFQRLGITASAASEAPSSDVKNRIVDQMIDYLDRGTIGQDADRLPRELRLAARVIAETEAGELSGPELDRLLDECVSECLSRPRKPKRTSRTLASLHPRREPAPHDGDVGAASDRPSSENRPPPQGASTPAGRPDLEEVKKRLHRQLIDKLDLSQVGQMDAAELRHDVRTVAQHLLDLDDTLLSRSERDRLIEECLDAILGRAPPPQAVAPNPPHESSSPASDLPDTAEVKRRLRDKMFGKMDLSNIGQMDRETLRQELWSVAEVALNQEDAALSPSERDRIIRECLDESLGPRRPPQDTALPSASAPPSAAPSPAPAMPPPRKSVDLAMRGGDEDDSMAMSAPAGRPAMPTSSRSEADTPWWLILLVNLALLVLACGGLYLLMRMFR